MTDPQPPPSSVTRGLQVLHAVLEAGYVRAASIADRTDLPLSTVYRHLRQLVDHEFVAERRGGYGVGPLLQYSIAGALSSEVLTTQSRTLLSKLAAETGETALGVTRFGLHAVVYAQAESRHMDRVGYHEGELLPLYAGASQRAILAFTSPAILTALLSKGLNKVTGATLDEPALLESLREVRRTGYAVSNEELTHGGLAVAVPVFTDGRVIASLCVQGPAHRCGAQWREEARLLLITAATELSHRLEHNSAQHAVALQGSEPSSAEGSDR